MKYFLLFFFVIFAAKSYELKIIQGLDNNTQTFYTRIPEPASVYENYIRGKRGTFTKENVSFVAEVDSKDDQYIYWRVVNNKNFSLPFIKGDTVIYHRQENYHYALTPIEEQVKRYKAKEWKPSNSINLKTAYLSTLSSSVSSVEPGTEKTRRGFNGEFLFENMLTLNTSFSIGGRFEQENIDLQPAIDANTTRLMALGYLSYYHTLSNFYSGRLFASAGIGYGSSNTVIANTEQGGKVFLLPAFVFGINLPFTNKVHFIGEAALETLSTVEEVEDIVQTTDQSNVRFAIGLKIFLDG